MANENRLIDANKLRERMFSYYGCVNEYSSKEHYRGETLMNYEVADMIEDCIDNAPSVDAVEVVRIEEVKQEILQKMDEFIAEYRSISQSYVDHFGGKADAMEVARRLVNAALYDLCPNCGAKMDGGEDDVSITD